MNLKELKDKIKYGILDDSTLIFKAKSDDSKWVISSYIKEISNLKNREIVYVDDLKDINNKYDLNTDYLFVFKTDKLESLDTLYKNLIIVAKEVASSIDCIDIPKLEEWQLQDYLKLKLAGLDPDDISFFLSNMKENIYLLDNEVNKLTSFIPAEQALVFHSLKKEGNYSFISNPSIFGLINCIVKRDSSKVSYYLTSIQSLSFMALVSLLINQFKNLIKVQMSAENTPAAKLGLSDTQYKAISYNKNKYKNSQLISIYKLLTSIDYQLKTGRLDMEEDYKIKWLVNQLFSLE